MSGPYLIGTSGWQYAHWRGIFYPQGLKTCDYLAYYCRFFDTVEVNVTFYRDVDVDTVERWCKVTPEGFLFSLKMSRFITHVKRLKVEPEVLARFFLKVRKFGGKCGVVLIQLPPSLRFERGLLEDFLSLLDQRFRYALEARNPTFLNESLFQLLAEKGVCWCISDSAGRFPYLEILTAPFVYVRLHGSQVLYGSSYTEEELLAWKQKLTGWGREAFVYFDNDYMGYAVKNALLLKEMLSPPAHRARFHPKETPRRET
jgi:uncharacterized protein YecE (DUF72 family)